jgi:hypothetical protein
MRSKAEISPISGRYANLASTITERVPATAFEGGH